jgi:hypothetical protein
LYFVLSENTELAVEHPHEHDSNHIDGDTGNRRIDTEIVRELVDCGGSDLGFCDMNSRYPGYVCYRKLSIAISLNCTVIDFVYFIYLYKTDNVLHLFLGT